MFILFENVTETKARVTTQHGFPDMLPEEIRDQGFEVSIIPEAEKQVGKDGILYCNPITHEVFYEYVDRPLNPEEEIVKLREELNTAKSDIGQQNQLLSDLLEVLYS